MYFGRKLIKLQHTYLTDLIQKIPIRFLQPLAITFFLTNRCNYRCLMCYQYEKLNREKQMKEMNLDQLKVIVQDIRRSFLFKPLIKITGGEPTVHSDFISLVHYLKQNGFRCLLNTNGFNLSSHIHELIEIGVDDVNFSILGSEETHDDITRVKGSFKRVVTNIKTLQKTKRKLNKNKPRLRVVCAISPSNYKVLSHVVEEVRKLKIETLYFQHLIFCEQDSKDVEKIDLNILVEQVKKINMHSNKLRIEFIPEIALKDLTVYYNNYNHSFSEKCIMPWAMLTIFPDGTIGSCFHTYLEFRIGNYFEIRKNFHEIWNDPRLNKFRDTLRHKGLFPACKRCCFRKYYG